MGFTTRHDDDGLRTIVLSHGAANLLTPDVMADLESELRDADADASVRSVLLCAEGEVFCGGLDIAAIRAGADPVAFAGGLVSLLHLLARLSTPIAAAVQGDALAGGVALVAAVDFAVAVPDARLGSHEVSVGVWPMVAQVPLAHRIGVRAAMENIGAGEPFSATRAREVGLVQAVVDPADLRATAIDWLRRAQRGGDAFARGRPSFYEFAAMPYDLALDAALERFASVFREDR